MAQGNTAAAKEFAVAMRYAKTDSCSGTPAVLEHNIIAALFEHSAIFCSFKPGIVQSLLDRYVEILKQLTVIRFGLSFEAHSQLKMFKYHKA